MLLGTYGESSHPFARKFKSGLTSTRFLLPPLQSDISFSSFTPTPIYSRFVVSDLIVRQAPSLTLFSIFSDCHAVPASSNGGPSSGQRTFPSRIPRLPPSSLDPVHWRILFFLFDFKSSVYRDGRRGTRDRGRGGGSPRGSSLDPPSSCFAACGRHRLHGSDCRVPHWKHRRDDLDWRSFEGVRCVDSSSSREFSLFFLPFSIRPFSDLVSLLRFRSETPLNMSPP